MKDKKRTLQIGFVWTLLFLVWWIPFLLITNWRFNPYYPSHWKFIFNEFSHGWILDSTSDWLFMITLILAIPMWLIGWRLCMNVQWKKLYSTIREKILYLVKGKPADKKPTKSKLKPRESHKKVRPVALSPIAQSAGTANKTPSAASSAKRTPPPTPAHTPSFLSQEEMDMPLEDVQLPEQVRLEENLVEIMQKSGYRVIQGPTIGEKQFDYMALDGDKIILCSIDTEKGDWLVDEDSFGGEAPLWFSETAHRSSPIYDMYQTATQFGEKLQKRNLKYEIIPMFIEKSGTIINADEMAALWKKMSVIVCRTDLGGPNELPSFKDALPPSDTPIEDMNIRAIQDLL